MKRWLEYLLSARGEHARLGDRLVFTGAGISLSVMWLALGAQALVARASGPIWALAAAGAVLVSVRPSFMKRPFVGGAVLWFTAINLALIALELLAMAAASRAGA